MESTQMDAARREEIVSLLKQTGSPDAIFSSLYAAADACISLTQEGRRSVLQKGLQLVADHESRHGTLSREEIIRIFEEGVHDIQETHRAFERSLPELASACWEH